TAENLELQGSLRTGRQDNKIDHQSSLIHNPIQRINS
ncbi:hypothetical protein LINPERHAP1_LOCUS13493, partial [Linum perenne]